MSEQRVMIFIDGSNLYHSLKKNKVLNIDYSKLIKLLIGDRYLVRVYYYNAPVNRKENEEKATAQQKFFNALSKIDRFELRLGRLEPRPKKCPECNASLLTHTEKGVDIMIATDMLAMAHRKSCDTAILVSGDGDFSYAVQAVKDFGINVEVACFKKNLANHLKKTADKIIYLDDLNLPKNCSLD